MKNILNAIVVIVLFLATYSVNAQESFSEKIPFSTFQSWVGIQSLDNYSYVDCYHDGEAAFGEKVEYAADYRSMEGGLKIKFSELSDFSSFKIMNTEGTMIFKLNDYDAIYIPLKAKYSSSMFVVKIPELLITVNIVAMPLLSKEQMQSIFESLDFKELESQISSK